MTAPVFVVDDLGAPEGTGTPGDPRAAAGAPAGGPRYVLEGPEGRHAVSVRRLRPGEEVVLTDGAGHWAACVVLDTEGRDRLVLGRGPVLAEPAPEPRLTVVQALPKGDRGERAVETMTETGVDAIVPWSATRCITQWKGERGVKALGKWRATAREAGKQSRRVRFPEVTEAMTGKQVAALLARAELAVVLHEDPGHPGEPLATTALPTSGDIVVVVGPEGSLTPEELDLFGEAGARVCRLGRTVLRTSTAGTAAAALLLGRTGRWS
ncbi:ribosomal RNA small subunit methyltransferase E [Streptomyces sulfonofaciens]|uniref:Ribosomal RNA small subunit methyltransferase E n=1 Tax=Streptomyces sulfonofaciens TaxID=68272 RepID=A0A919GM58_9ACTN|nr:16S rRNA (uracil(1498)-N(3))-methyltransferase [Streptomyces sulfonofaciens]GHH87350.1 ribosomal RNA small subunit methyltransferase E [Streptomyces sulfonofaciens]